LGNIRKFTEGNFPWGISRGGKFQAEIFQEEFDISGSWEFQGMLRRITINQKVVLSRYYCHYYYGYDNCY